MGDYSGKKPVAGLSVRRMGSGSVLRNTPDRQNQNVQFCNRIGCSGRMNSAKGISSGSLEKPKMPLRPLFRTSSGKDMVGSSSRNSSLQNSPRKSLVEPRKKVSDQLETDSSLSTSDDHEMESELPRNVKCSEVSSNEVGMSNVASTTRKQMNLIKKSGLGKQPGPSVSLKSTNASRHGLRNIRSDSTSDATESSRSSSDLGPNRKKVAVAKRNSVGESSSFTKGKKRIEPSVQSSSNGLSISDSRRTRNCSLPNRDNGALRSIDGAPRIRPSIQNNSNISSHNELPIIMRQMAEHEASVPSSSQSRSKILNSYSRPGSNSSGSSRSRFPGSPSEGAISRRVLMNRDGFHRFNLDGIAEVLMALERIEQDEELSYEQLLVLEENLSLNGLSFYDQHRDMRLDIDNMTYEELLALEEKMGTVSTALTEEALEKFIISSIHKTTPPEAHLAGDDGDDNNAAVKCSICQEEYIEGDELGRLQCEHSYHLSCIHQWLRLKNWCPVCKVSATSLS